MVGSFEAVDAIQYLEDRVKLAGIRIACYSKFRSMGEEFWVLPVKRENVDV